MSKNESRHERLLDLIVEALSEDQAEAERYLSEQGVEIEASVDGNWAFFRRLKARAEIEDARSELGRRDAEPTRLRGLIEDKLSGLSLSPRDFLAEMQRRGIVSMSFSSIDALDDSDAIDIIEEAGLVNELERLANESFER